jgi:hypothetical protein
MKLRMMLSAVTLSFGMAQAAMALNPQPEPPGVHHGTVHLNPQPEPPGVTHSAHVTVKLNPQPEPPGVFKPRPTPH